MCRSIWWRKSFTLLALGDLDPGVYGAQWSPSRDWVAASATGGDVRILRCDTCGPLTEVRALADARVSRDLTPQERAIYLPD